GRVAEQGRAGGGTDEWFAVDERAGGLGGDAGLTVGEQGERGEGTQQCQRDGGERTGGAAGCRGYALGQGGDGQCGGRRGEELHRGDRDRVATGQQPRLRHGERGR